MGNMGNRFEEKIAQLKAEVAEIERELPHAPAAQQGQLKARRASILRSLRWYAARPAGYGTPTQPG